MQVQFVISILVLTTIQASIAVPFSEDDFLFAFDPISSGSSRRRSSKSKSKLSHPRSKHLDNRPFVPLIPIIDDPKADDSAEVIFSSNYKKTVPKRKHSYEDYSSEEDYVTATTTTTTTTTTTPPPENSFEDSSEEIYTPTSPTTTTTPSTTTTTTTTTITTTPAPTTTSTTPTTTTPFPIPYNDTRPDPAAFDGPVHPREFPGYAVFLYQPYPFCGGTLVTQKHILTAGHCFHKLLQVPGTISRVRVYVNAVTLVPVSSEAVVRAVKNVYVHPKFDEGAPGRFLKNDIALVELDEEVEEVRRTRLPKRIEHYEKELISLFGFGIRPWTFGYVSGLHPTTDYFLKHISSNIISNHLCASAWNDSSLTDHQYICTTPNRGPCFGDGGAPVMSDGLGQIAVTSYKYWHCKANLPAVHTRISPYKDWIKYIVDDD